LSVIGLNGFNVDAKALLLEGKVFIEMNKDKNEVYKSFNQLFAETKKSTLHCLRSGHLM